MGGGSKKNVVQQIADVGRESINISTGGLLTQTKEGKKATGQAWQAAEQAGTTATEIATGGLLTQTPKGQAAIQAGTEAIANLDPELAKRRAEEEARLAAEEQAKAEQELANQALKKKRSGEYAGMRARQKSLMGAQSGRAGTILTSPQDISGKLGSGTGKTLLGI